MGKKKHPEHVNHERWLVSYADLLTLLFAFFVVLFASSVSDKKKSTKMATAMQTAFQQSGIFDTHAKTPPLVDGAGTSQGTPAPIEMPLETPDAHGETGDGTGINARREMDRHGTDRHGTDRHGTDRPAIDRPAMERAVASAVRQHMITMRDADEGLTLSLDSAGFFPSGSAQVRPAALPLLAQVAASLPQGPLRIEGHTDNQPIHTAQYRSNWELSTARAAAIADVLLRDSRVPPANVSLAGYAEFHPIANNNTDAGRAANRRVDIVLLRTRVETAGIAMGRQKTAAGTAAATLTKSVDLPPLPAPPRHPPAR